MMPWKNIWIQGIHKRDFVYQGFHCPGTFPIFSPGDFLDFFSPGTTGPQDLQGLQVLSCQDHGTQDLLSRGSWGSRRDQVIFSFFSAYYCIFFDLFCCCITRAKKREERIWPSICSVCRQVRREGLAIIALFWQILPKSSYYCYFFTSYLFKTIVVQKDAANLSKYLN